MHDKRPYNDYRERGLLIPLLLWELVKLPYYLYRWATKKRGATKAEIKAHEERHKEYRRKRFNKKK
jgi:hypothetical protein